MDAASTSNMQFINSGEYVKIYIVEVGDKIVRVPAAKVGTYPDIRAVDNPILAPAAFWPYLPAIRVWSITLVEE